MGRALGYFWNFCRYWMSWTCSGVGRILGFFWNFSSHWICWTCRGAGIGNWGCIGELLQCWTCWSWIWGLLTDSRGVSLFFVFNSLLPGTDVGTDLYTYYDLYSSGQYYWASSTFYLMWNPVIVQFLFMMARLWKNPSKFETRKEMMKLFIHLPFVTPFKNVYNTYRLIKLKFGMRSFEDHNSKEVEEIQDEAGRASMSESFLEAGPQAVVQLNIVLSTGKISPAQMVSIPVSVFSLAWASSRAYFIERDDDHSDPDPEQKMQCMCFH